MSLIQDALRRKAEEGSSAQPQQPPVAPYKPPVQPAEPPVKPAEPPEDKKETRPFFILTTVVLISLLIVFLAGLGIYLIKPRAPKTVAQTPAPVTAPAAVPQPAVTPQPIATPQPVVTPQPAATPQPAVAPQAVAMPQPPEPATKAAKTEPVAEPVKKDAAPPIPKEQWPALNLTGIGQSSSHKIAFINDKILSVGRSLGDVVIMEISETTVVVEYRGERRTLHINE